MIPQSPKQNIEKIPTCFSPDYRATVLVPKMWSNYYEQSIKIRLLWMRQASKISDTKYRLMKGCVTLIQIVPLNFKCPEVGLLNI